MKKWLLSLIWSLAPHGSSSTWPHAIVPLIHPTCELAGFHPKPALGFSTQTDELLLVQKFLHCFSYQLFCLFNISHSVYSTISCCSVNHNPSTWAELGSVVFLAGVALLLSLGVLLLWFCFVSVLFCFRPRISIHSNTCHSATALEQLLLPRSLSPFRLAELPRFSTGAAPLLGPPQGTDASAFPAQRTPPQPARLEALGACGRSRCGQVPSGRQGAALRAGAGTGRRLARAARGPREISAPPSPSLPASCFLFDKPLPQKGRGSPRGLVACPRPAEDSDRGLPPPRRCPVSVRPRGAGGWGRAAGPEGARRGGRGLSSAPLRTRTRRLAGCGRGQPPPHRAPAPPREAWGARRGWGARGGRGSEGWAGSWAAGMGGGAAGGAGRAAPHRCERDGEPPSFGERERRALLALSDRSERAKPAFCFDWGPSGPASAVAARGAFLPSALRVSPAAGPRRLCRAVPQRCPKFLGGLHRPARGRRCACISWPHRQSRRLPVPYVLDPIGSAEKSLVCEGWHIR